MTPSQLDLARQLVTSPRMQWLSGCRWRFDLSHHADLWQVHDPLWIDEDGVVLKNTPPTARGRVVIDLSDPATVGCIAHLAIEAWGAAPVYVRRSANGRWFIVAPGHLGTQAGAPGRAIYDTPGEAWATLLLAAPEPQP